jgi:hypothetical protein
LFNSTVDSLRQWISKELAKREVQRRPEPLTVTALPTHFEKERFTDLEIRVKLKPSRDDDLCEAASSSSSSRTVLDDSGSQSDHALRDGPPPKRVRRSSLPPVHDGRATIKAHSLILSSRSTFFEEELKDQQAPPPWVIDVTLEDEDGEWPHCSSRLSR